MELGRDRRKNEATSRPVIFVAHSLGGRVAESALLHCRAVQHDNYQLLAKSTKAIAFLGTPHRGSEHGALLSTTTKVTSLFHPINKPLIDVLKRDSEVLAGLQDQFHHLIRPKPTDAPDIFCFYEGHVSGSENLLMRSASHSGMTKFTSERDAGFISVAGQLLEWLEDIKAREAQAGSNFQSGLQGRPGGLQHAGGDAAHDSGGKNEHGCVMGDESGIGTGFPFRGQRQLTNEDSSKHSTWRQENHFLGIVSSNGGTIYQGNRDIYQGHVPNEAPPESSYRPYPAGSDYRPSPAWLSPHAMHRAGNENANEVADDSISSGTPATENEEQDEGSMRRRNVGDIEQGRN